MNLIVKKYPMLGSSVDKEKLSKTWTNTALLLIPVLITVFGLFGVEINVVDLTTVSDSVLDSVIVIWGAYHSCQIAYGAIRKVIIKIKN